MEIAIETTQDKHPCQEGHRCLYGNFSGKTYVCPFANCVLTKFEDEVDGTQLLDTLTGVWSAFKPQPMPKEKPDPVDEWYERWLKEQGFGYYARLMSNHDTYPTKTGGKIVQKRRAKT